MAFQGDSIYWVEVEKVVANPFQPRREFDEGKLQELADSIRMYGVLQPLTVTRKEVQQENGTFYTEYELIAGERRMRASKLAGVNQVPVIIREGEQSEQEKLELAIIENLQREDLNAVDRALAFRQLADTFSLSHTQVAQKVGRSREYVSNSIRLLGLPEHMLDALRRAELSEGHARTLLMLTDRPEEQEVIFKEIVRKKLSVREAERIIRKIATDKVRKKNPSEFDAHLIEIEKQFTETLGTRVQIQKTDFGGKLTIDYFSEDDLQGILRRVREEVNERAATVAKEVEQLAAATPLAMTAAAPSEPEAFTDAPRPAQEERVDELPVSEEPVAPQAITDDVPLPQERTAESSEPSPQPSQHEPVVAEEDQAPTKPAVSAWWQTPQPNAPEQPAGPEQSNQDAEPEPSAVPASPETQPPPEPEKQRDLSRPAPPETPDESDLYSMRNFGI